MIKRIVLACPPSSDGSAYFNGCWYPEGLVSLGTEVRKHRPDIEVVILDGNVLGQEEIVRRSLDLGPDLLGISTHTSLAYGNCLDLLAAAQQAGVPCVMGGIHVNTCPSWIAEDRDVDVITGQGESSLPHYIEYLEGEREKQAVPGLVWKTGPGQIHIVPEAPWLGIETLPTPDLDLVNFAPYHANILRTGINHRDAGTNVGVVKTHQGCVWRDVTGGGCTFCTLPEQSFFPPPEAVWRKIRYAYEYHGSLTWIKDWGDCFTGSWDWVKRLLDVRPADLIPGEHYWLEVYTKPDEINEQWHVDLMVELGIATAFVGFESGSTRMLGAMRKGSTRTKHEHCTRLLAGSDIGIVCLFVLGMQGESRETLQESLDFATFLKRTLGEQLEVTGGSPVLPLPGSPMWKELVPHLTGPRDNPNLRAAQDTWFDMRCPNLGHTIADKRTLLEEYCEAICAVAGTPHRFGINSREES